MDPEENRDEYQDSFHSFSLEVSRDRVESLWKQAMTRKNSGRTELAAAKATRARAEIEKQRISKEALEATREACRELIGGTERQLANAKDVEAEVERNLAEAQEQTKKAEMDRADADSYRKGVTTEAEGYREKVVTEADGHREKVVAEADAYREAVMAEAQQEAQRIRDEARSAVLHECEELKRHVTYEVQCILSEVDDMRAAAEEEREAQRIYSEAANIRAMPHDVRSSMSAGADRSPNGGNTTNGDGSTMENAGPWEAIETSASTSPDHVEAMADEDHQSGRVGPMVGASGRKSAKNGKGSSRSAS